MKKKAALLTIYLFLFWACAYAGSSANEQDQDASAGIERVLERLEEKMSGITTLKTDFVQKKKLAVLDQPLVLKGTVFMQKPSLFAWHVKEPMRYSMVMKDEIIRQWDEDTQRIQQVSLSDNPAFKAVIRQMQDWFSGAYMSLFREYNVTVINEDPVSLKFVPRKTATAYDIIDGVTVIFEKDERYIRRIYIEEKSGDNTVLSFVDTLLNIPLDDAVWKVKRRVQ